MLSASVNSRKETPPQCTSSPHPPSGTSTPDSSPHSPHHRRSSPCAKNKDLTADVARLIEERDVLLKTELYSSNDEIIQRIDNKIQLAMMEMDREK